MDSKLIYLIGTEHNKGIEASSEIDDAIRQSDKILIEGIDEDNFKISQQLVKDPLLTIGVLIWFRYLTVKGSDGSNTTRDRTSMISLRNRVASKETKPMQQCDGSLEDMMNKHYKWYAIPVEILSIVILTLLVKPNVSFGLAISIPVCIVVVGAIRLGYFALIQTYADRNRLMVNNTIDFLNKGSSKVLIFYGSAHISMKGNQNRFVRLIPWLFTGKTLEDMFNKERVPVKIIRAKFI